MLSEISGLAKGAKETFPHSRAVIMTGYKCPAAPGLPKCGVPVGGLPLWVLCGGRGSCGAGPPTWLSCAFLAVFSLLMRACTSLTATAVHRKGKQSGRSPPLLDMYPFVGGTGSSLWNCPSCKFTADLQLSAGQFTITLNTLTPTVSWVSIRQWLLSQTSSQRLPLWQCYSIRYARLCFPL